MKKAQAKICNILFWPISKWFWPKALLLPRNCGAFNVAAATSLVEGVATAKGNNAEWVCVKFDEDSIKYFSQQWSLWKDLIWGTYFSSILPSLR